MTCDPNALMDAARCFKCLMQGMQAPVQIALLAQWAGCVTPTPTPTPPPSAPFSWSPPSAIVNWNDVNHPGAGANTDYPTFLATANIATVSVIATNDPTITSFSNISSLPALAIWQTEGIPLLTTLDFTGCSNLPEIHISYNVALTSVNFTGCSSLNTLFMVGLTSLTTVINLTGTMYAIDLSVDNGTPNLSSLTFGPCPNTVGLLCYGTKLSSLDPSLLVALEYLDCYTCLIHTPEINAILVSLDSNAHFKSTPGFSDMSGQTPAAPPSGLGAAAKLDLVNVWGCAITTD